MEDEKLEAVRYFELDETERINVTRPQADMKRFDMKHEAQLMMEAKKDRCHNYHPWKLIPIDLEPTDIERGCNSKEKEIQAERQKTTLECFYLQNRIPDSAMEPDNTFYPDSLRIDPVIIPLEDDSATGVDYDITTSSINTNYDYNPVFNIVDPNQQIGGYIPTNDSMQLPASTSYNPNQNANFGPPAGSGYQQQPNSSGYMPSMNMYDAPNSSGPPPSYNPNTNVDQYSSNTLGMSSSIFNNNTTNNVNNNTNPPIYQDYAPPQHNVEPPFNNQLPPPMFNQASSNEPSPSYNSNNNYMNDNNQQNFPPMRPSWQSGPQPGGGPPISSGPSGPIGPRPSRFRNPGPGNVGGSAGRGRSFAPRGANNPICRFYSKFGKCKFGNNCNFSHNIDSKPSRF